MYCKGWLAALLFSVVMYTAQCQTLDGYVGAGIGCDNFMRDKTVTNSVSTAPFLFSPQFVAGLRLHPKTNFLLMVDATLGLSRIGLLTGNADYKLYYEQVRALVTAGSGLYIPLDRDRYVLPFINLGAGFYDFNGLTAKDGQNTFGLSQDYDTKHWVVVCGAGVEYKFRMFIPSTVNFRFLYTPLDIFPEPFKYEVGSGSTKKTYLLQGKLLQILLTYQIPFSIFSRQDKY